MTMSWQAQPSSSRSAALPVILLYDVPGHSPQPWAPNIWRIRFILNYKRLRYKTIWVEFPEVETTLRSITPKILSNTNTIAEYLESTYPARPVFPDGTRALQSLFVHYIQEVFAKPLLPIMVPLSHQQLSERTQAHFRGVQYPQGGLTGPQREQAWHTVKEQFDFLAAIMEKNCGDGDGVVAMGHEVSYADFALCSVLIWIERMAAHDGWARVRTWNGGRWHRLWERCKEYMDEY
ncbi:hypothetical protein BDQ17DRAFT_1390735 [Cyathus striatus]|nr:hypothetical protein BDQ17DRAFT_1390735 [Cyathus striatus]